MSTVKITHYPDGCQLEFCDWSPYANSDISRKKKSSAGGGMAPADSARIALQRTRRMVFDYARCNKFDYFVTLTFDPKQVDSFDYDECVKKMSVWLNHIRRRCPDMVYLGVPELHKSGRYHFHFLMRDIDGMGLVDSGHRDKHGHIVYNVGSYKLGWSTAIRLYEQGAALAKYLSKYISKDMSQHKAGRKRYWCSRGLDLPRSYTYVWDSDRVAEFLATKVVTYDKVRDFDGLYHYRVVDFHDRG